MRPRIMSYEIPPSTNHTCLKSRQHRLQHGQGVLLPSRSMPKQPHSHYRRNDHRRCEGTMTAAATRR